MSFLIFALYFFMILVVTCVLRPVESNLESHELVQFNSENEYYIGTDLNFTKVLMDNKEYKSMVDYCPLRIYGGTYADITTVPYQVTIRRRTYGTYWVQFCGGTLVTTRFILTAAHCFVDNYGRTTPLSNLRLIAGSVRADASENHMSRWEYWRSIKNFWRHKHYHLKYYQNDFGVIETSSDFVTSKSIKPIKMHTEDSYVELEENLECITSGYGLMENEEFPTALRAVCVPIVDVKTCKIYYGSVYVNNRTFCAGSFGKDSCQGDSGGPIVCKGVLTGIVSFGGSCGMTPGVYTKLLSYTSGEYVPLVQACSQKILCFSFFLFMLAYNLVNILRSLEINVG